MKHAGIIAATLLAWACGGAALAGQNYDCKIKAHSSDGFVPSRVLVFFEDDFAAAHVYDDYIHTYRKHAIQAELTQMGPKKYQLSWDLDGVETTRERVMTSNILRIDIGRMRATYTGYVKGYFNYNRGSGKCVIWKKKK